MKILITGGLGYIGSHLANLLGKKAIIIDNMSNSSLNFKKYLPKAKVYVGDINKENLNKIFLKNKIQGVVHLASLKSVEDSFKNPTMYYKSNIIPTLDLLDSMSNHKINKLIFSSSATVYGNINKCPYDETMNLKSNNAYGSTKIVIENLITDFASSFKKFKAISLRYFNPIGADYKAGLADKPTGNVQNIMPAITKSAKKNKLLKIFGDQYNTNDGTCVRDYIHIKDLVFAHLLAYNKLSSIKGHMPINLGLGRGISVLKLIKIFEKTNNIKINFKIVKARKGDVDNSFANCAKAKKILGWKPIYNYSDMVRDAWNAVNF